MIALHCPALSLLVLDLTCFGLELLHQDKPLAESGAAGANLLLAHPSMITACSSSQSLPSFLSSSLLLSSTQDYYTPGCCTANWQQTSPLEAAQHFDQRIVRELWLSQRRLSNEDPCGVPWHSTSKRAPRGRAADGGRAAKRVKVVSQPLRGALETPPLEVTDKTLPQARLPLDQSRTAS